MTQAEYLVLGISILVFLLAVFVISFVLFKKTPVPAGCEDIKISEENCSKCQNKGCQMYKGEDK